MDDEEQMNNDKTKSNNADHKEEAHSNISTPPSNKNVIWFISFLSFHQIVSFIFMNPMLPKIYGRITGNTINSDHPFNFDIHSDNFILKPSTSIFDLFLSTTVITILSLISLYKSYKCKELFKYKSNPYLHFQQQPNTPQINQGTTTGNSNDLGSSSTSSIYNNDNKLKTKEEYEEQSLEESISSWWKRFSSRYAFKTELCCFFQGLYIIVKCLSRLNLEIGVLHNNSIQYYHPMFWILLLFCGLSCTCIGIYCESIGIIVSDIGNWNREYGHRDIQRSPWCFTCFRKKQENSVRVTSSSELDLQEPLLQNNHCESIEKLYLDDEIEPLNINMIDHRNESTTSSVSTSPSKVCETDAISDITSESHYHATLSDLFSICYPDLHLILVAFVFLVLAAIAQIFIPRFMGNMLDALTNYDSSHHDDGSDNIWDLTDFLPNMKKLILSSILGGIFAGCRGSIFTLVGGRVNVRLRILLMDSLLSQDIGFFDVTKTGDITSRLSSDTTKVGDQVTLNINVFLRSLVQAIGVLVFMTVLSWQLTLLAFISVPVITMLSRWYGQFMRKLSKLMQKKLADGNSVSEAAFSSMTTIRSLGAEHVTLHEFQLCMERYLDLNLKSATATIGYATFYGSLPQLVTAVVLFYGGLLVLSDGDNHISCGQLVSFVLYLNSLSDAFGSIGSIFVSLTQAVGAADKVFELIKRKPKRRIPNTAPVDQPRMRNRKISKTSEWNKIHGMGNTTNCIDKFRQEGIFIDDCLGEITFDKVTMFYPARPERKILDEISLRIPQGSVIALVGASGGGKSSIISLILNQYQVADGSVCIDGNDVSDLSPDWFKSHVAVVSQEPTLFAKSIRQNIIYGLEGTENEPTFDEIKEAARSANASSFIESLPSQYETDVGERGVQLSGGQKQRIAISRALVRKPRILLLDEATSALDAESEGAVQESIDLMIDRGRLSSNPSSPSMTVVIVAHRLSTVRNADIIFVIDTGKVVEKGSHDELLLLPDGVYSNLVKRQMQAQAKLE